MSETDREQLRALGNCCPDCTAAFRRLQDGDGPAIPTLKRLFPRALLEAEEIMAWALKGKHAAEPWRTDSIPYLVGKALKHLGRELVGQPIDAESRKRGAVHTLTRVMMLSLIHI